MSETVVKIPAVVKAFEDRPSAAGPLAQTYHSIDTLGKRDHEKRGFP
jgi:hypothetical protein